MKLQAYAVVFTFLCDSVLVSGIPKPFCDGDDKFLCDSGECIDEELHCDHKDDCTDSSDEINCGTTAANVYRCIISGSNSFICEDGKCISNSQLCNGIKDCTSGLDEKCSTDVPVHPPSVATSVVILTIVILFICGALFGTLVFLQQRRMFQIHRRQRQLTMQRQRRQVQVVTADLFTTVREETDEDNPGPS